MRIAGGHALGEEAAGVVQQAVSLAGRRGHAQVTPLHIASAMLSVPSSAGIFRAACVRSQSHPLQHNALELCLNLALDQLKVARPAMASAAGNNGGARVDPVPSNAFAAALKRAQSHRRQDGKVELEQLVLSILDDPSVDRVMRAAGFSSSQVVRASVENVILSEKADRAGGQPSLQAVHVPDHGSEIQASQAKSGRPVSPVLFDGSKVVATTAILPPWLRRYKETIRTRSTRYDTTSPLQVDLAARRGPKFTELTAHNLKILCDALELRCPGHGDIVLGISSAVLLCRSGMARRRARIPPCSPLLRTTTWLLFQGRDSGGKMAVARELARLVFGTHTDFTVLQPGNSDEPSRSGKLTSKRRRCPSDGDGGYAVARLLEAIVENPHRVIFIDGVDRLDHDSEIRIKDVIMKGTIRGRNGDVVRLDDAIVVLCSDVLNWRSVVSSPRVKPRLEEEGDATGKEVRPRPRLSLDLNASQEDEEDEHDILADREAILNFVDGVFFFN